MPTQRHANLVTGASRGIGRAIVEGILAVGETVTGVSRSVAPWRDRAGATPVLADLSDPGVAARITDEFCDRIPDGAGTVTFIANAAQLSPIGLVGELNPPDTAAAVSTNLVTPIVMTDRLIARLTQVDSVPRALRIILVSSGAAQRPMPGLSVYGAGKAGLNAFAASVQAEAAVRGMDLRVWAVSPGIVDTGMQETLRDQPVHRLPEGDLYRRWYEEGQLRTPADAAATILGLRDREDLEPGRYYHINEIADR